MNPYQHNQQLSSNPNYIENNHYKEQNRSYTNSNNHNIPSSRRSSQFPNLSQGLPQKQQWGLIYKQAQQQQKRMQLMQKNYIKIKQKQMKQALDRQILQKKSYGGNQKLYDQQYKQWTLDRIKKQQEKQRNQQEKRRMKRKQMQDINFYNLSLKQQSISKQFIPSQQRNHINNQHYHSSQKKQNSLKQPRNNQVNKSAIYSFDKQKRNYQNVYDIYSDLVKQQNSKIKQQQQKILKDAQRIRQNSLKKDQVKKIMKQEDKKRVKEVLDHQVQIHSMQENQSKRVNPQQDVSYKLFSNLNRESVKMRAPPQHAAYLQKQIQEERARKMKSKYMSEEQYRLNMDQLNKAVNGRYNYDGYQDRSVNSISIGQRLRNFAKAGSEMNRLLNHQKQNSSRNSNETTPMKNSSNNKYENFQVDSQVVRRKIDELNHRRRAGDTGDAHNQQGVSRINYKNNIFG